MGFNAVSIRWSDYIFLNDNATDFAQPDCAVASQVDILQSLTRPGWVSGCKVDRQATASVCKPHYGCLNLIRRPGHSCLHCASSDCQVEVHDEMHRPR